MENKTAQNSAAPGRDWNALNGISLVDAIDRLYREQMDHSIEWHTRHVGGWGALPIGKTSK